MLNYKELPVLKALSLKLIPLDCQIRAHGGTGFNSSVIVRPVPNSFSVKYIFDTNSGKKVLVTPNNVQLAMLDDGEHHFIYYNGQNKKYTSVTPKFLANPPYKTLKIEHLGNSYEEMLDSVKARWGNNIEKILHPDSLQYILQYM